MPRQLLGPLWLVVPVLPLLVLTWSFLSTETTVKAAPGTTSGSLQIIGKDGSVSGACPLKHTEVHGAISGFIARVEVSQTFENSAFQKIEAVYTFPLPENAAVDDMTIQVGTRTVRGLIKKREEARAIYEQAKQTGHVAALLDQERPNIFAQAVANIMPGEQVVVTISYLQTLEYEDGAYKFVFPMVVGPRYIPGQPTGKQGGGREPDTDKVPDASKITPQITPPGTRAGHDISIEMAIDAGVPIQQLQSSSHEIEIDRTSANSAFVKLKNQAEVPNRDFILKYDVAGEQISDAVLSQAAPANGKLGTGGYFTLILQPPARIPESDITPKELVFVLDTSGSMSGFPIEKAKDLISHALDELYPGDTFNLITFSGDTQILFPEPVFPTAENIRKAKALLNGRRGYGGTEMMKAIRASLAPSDSQDHLRVVCFLTDGEVGNDLEILGEIKKHANARVFAFGIGSSVNRFLIEGMAKAGRGASEVVTLDDQAGPAAHRLYERLRSPLLTDVSIDWGGLPVTEVYPQHLPDLFSGKPLVISGRYTAAASGSIHIRGKRAGESFVRDIAVSFSAIEGKYRIQSSFWARRKIDDLMSQDWAGLQNGNVKASVQKEIAQLGLEYRLMTQFTSFVAVEERVVTQDGKPVRVEVPVEMPEGVSYEGVFGNEQVQGLALNGRQYSRLQQFAYLSSAKRVTGGGGSGSGAGGGSGSFGGVVGGALHVPSTIPVAPPAPPPPAAQPAIASDAEIRESPPVDQKPASDRTLLESKLHPTLLEAFDCWKKSGSDCKLAPGGTVEVQVWLTDDSAAVLEQLRTAGFAASQDRPKEKVVAGTIPVDKLADLAKIGAVRFISRARR
ncbi:MAG TPA: VIT and VWA domain-containing protein [Terriglobales bacterium]|jgi:Ca-activated chloride channel family protein|nr:VIT and VWA domain-containing protein [Terriglobales bacterium]